MKLRIGKYNQDNLGGVLINFLIAGVIILLLLMLYFFVYLPSATNHGETITVPDIQGRHIDELDEILLTKDLRYEVDDSSYSADYKPLTVLKQYPHAGAKVKEGRVIYISINSITPPTVPLPDLTGNSALNADMVLKSNDLKRGRIQLVSGGFLNMVKSMKYKGATIEPGTRIPKGSVIDLVVEDGGGGQFDLQSLIGQPYDEAEVYIRGANLILGDVELVGEDTTGVGAVVLKQVPAAGEIVKVGDIVDLWIGKQGTPPPTDEELDEAASNP